MPVSRRLPKRLRAVLGEDAEEELVTILDEIRSDRADSVARMEEWRRESAARFDRMDEWRRESATRFDRIDDRLERIETRVADVKSDLMKWSFVFWCGAIASVAALAGVLR